MESKSSGYKWPRFSPTSLVSPSQQTRERKACANTFVQMNLRIKVAVNPALLWKVTEGLFISFEKLIENGSVSAATDQLSKSSVEVAGVMTATLVTPSPLA